MATINNPKSNGETNKVINIYSLGFDILQPAFMSKKMREELKLKQE